MMMSGQAFNKKLCTSKKGIGQTPIPFFMINSISLK